MRRPARLRRASVALCALAAAVGSAADTPEARALNVQSVQVQTVQRMLAAQCFSRAIGLPLETAGEGFLKSYDGGLYLENLQDGLLPASPLGRRLKKKEARPCYLPVGSIKTEGGTKGDLIRARYARYLANWPLYERYPQSAYELDTLGLGWKDQIGGAGTKDSLVDILFGAVRSMTRWSITILHEAFTLELVSKMADAIGKSLTRLGGGFYKLFLPIGFASWALWILWQGIIRRRTVETFGDIAVAGLCLVAGLYVVQSPTHIIKQANDLSAALTTEITGLVGKADPSGARRRRYYKDAGREELARQGERLWSVFVFDTWAYMELGALPRGNPTPGGKPDTALDRSVRDAAFRILTTPPDHRHKEGDPDEGDLTLPDLKQANGAPFTAFKKEHASSRVLVVLLLLVASGVFTGIVIAIALQLLLAQVMFLLLVLAGGLVLPLAMLPHTGRRLLRAWALAAAGALFVKVVFSALVAALLLVASVLIEESRAAAGIGMTLAILPALFYLTYRYRSHVFKTPMRLASAGGPALAGSIRQDLGTAGGLLRGTSRRGAGVGHVAAGAALAGGGRFGRDAAKATAASATSERTRRAAEWVEEKAAVTQGLGKATVERGQNRWRGVRYRNQPIGGHLEQATGDTARKQQEALEGAKERGLRDQQVRDYVGRATDPAGRELRRQRANDAARRVDAFGREWERQEVSDQVRTTRGVDAQTAGGLAAAANALPSDKATLSSRLAATVPAFGEKGAAEFVGSLSRKDRAELGRQLVYFPHRRGVKEPVAYMKTAVRKGYDAPKPKQGGRGVSQAMRGGQGASSKSRGKGGAQPKSKRAKDKPSAKSKRGKRTAARTPGPPKKHGRS